MEFCCENFKSYYESALLEDRELFPNLRIVRIDNIHNSNNKNSNYRFLLVCGFIANKPPYVNLSYCPFCGIHLFSYYNKDEYINGESNMFF